MKISAKMHHGLKTLIELVLNAGEKGMLQKQIVEKFGMPNKFMDSVIHDLKVAGIIVNVAGKKSGYKLSRNPADISLYDVFRAFEPELRLYYCLADKGRCISSQSCAAHCFLKEFNNKMESFLKSNTIAEIANKQSKLDMKASTSSFHRP